MPNHLNLALGYAEQGIPVLPVRGAPEGKFKAKTPLLPNGVKGATLNERIIGILFGERYPDAMVATPTGKASGFFVLDLDIKDTGNGHEWLTGQEDKHGPLPATRRVATMSGGTHLFFRHIEGVRARVGIGKCVDVRGDDSYVVAAGSVAADGRAYRIVDDSPIAEAPRWLIDLLLPKVIAMPYRPYVPGTADMYVAAAVRSVLERVAATPAGGRGSRLNASAFALGQFVGAGALVRDEAECGLWDAAVACGIAAKDGERETRAKIRRGLDAGEKQPRSIPERTDATPLIDTSRLIANGLRKRAA